MHCDRCELALAVSLPCLLDVSISCFTNVDRSGRVENTGYCPDVNTEKLLTHCLHPSRRCSLAPHTHKRLSREQQFFGPPLKSSRKNPHLQIEKKNIQAKSLKKRKELIIAFPVFRRTGQPRVIIITSAYLCAPFLRMELRFVAAAALVFLTFCVHTSLSQGKTENTKEKKTNLFYKTTGH